MAELLMPKATAVWLIDNTTLTFDQIAAFCELHPLEVQGIADGEVAIGIRGLDPVANGQVSREEIQRCEGDSSQRLEATGAASAVPQRARRARYTPVSKRQDRPNAIAWLLKNYDELSDAQIGKLLGTTKATISAVRERTHWNTPNITAAGSDPAGNLYRGGASRCGAKSPRQGGAGGGAGREGSPGRRSHLCRSRSGARGIAGSAGR